MYNIGNIKDKKKYIIEKQYFSFEIITLISEKSTTFDHMCYKDNRLGNRI